MKLTKENLKQIIKEEMQRFDEGPHKDWEGMTDAATGAAIAAKEEKFTAIVKSMIGLDFSAAAMINIINHIDNAGSVTEFPPKGQTFPMPSHSYQEAYSRTKKKTK